MTITGEISISEKLRSRHDIPVNKTIKVRVGSRIVESKLRIKENSTGYLLSPSLERALLIKSSKRLKIRYDAEEKMIHLGPVIGVLAAALPNRANRDELDPTSLQAELSYLSYVGRSIPGIVYIFLPSSINWNSQKAMGYNYRFISPQGGIWESAAYPVPDVVYNRISSRKSEIKNSVQCTLNMFNELPYTKVFNPSYLNKWQVYQMLTRNSQLNAYLPETLKLNEETLKAMMGRYNVLYLKPSNGSLGRGIIKVRKLSGGNLKYTVYSRGRVNGYAEDARQLLRKTKNYRKGKPYVVQQGLNLSRYRGSVFDIRIIYQKNGRGDWQIGKKFARIAPGSSSISNLSRGGRVETSRHLMKALYKKKNLIDEKNAAISQLCKLIAFTFDIEGAGNFGELGLDIGIDKKGQPWLIEVNSKPRKTTETETSHVIMRNSFKRPLDYASYLAGFPVKAKSSS